MSADICTIEDCAKPRKGSRYCHMHAERIRRHGDPHFFIPQSARALRGEAHPGWTAVPSYSAIHQRLTRARGSAKTYLCACGEAARQWAYTGPRSAGERHPHEADLSLYVAMCVSCHKRMDMERIAHLEKGAA